MANSKSLQSYTEISSLKASRDNVQNVTFYPRAFSDADFRPHVYYVSGHGMIYAFLHPSSQLPHLIIIGSIPLRISSIYLSFALNARCAVRASSPMLFNLPYIHHHPTSEEGKTTRPKHRPTSPHTPPLCGGVLKEKVWNPMGRRGGKNDQKELQPRLFRKRGRRSVKLEDVPTLPPRFPE
ncbi:hypothetical protein PNOK_0306600 [Pyrrhoderma noxium]|uniref:Uncharacterized protein n=1 Tax=Pyrrhoderma noxium TaxID=2282107 RepID=A0A286ULM5_9AGAM|nr:hypothetical protein PNOK_0306600 [Pyrrhoderma noxium]